VRVLPALQGITLHPGLRQSWASTHPNFPWRFHGSLLFVIPTCTQHRFRAASVWSRRLDVAAAFWTLAYAHSRVRCGAFAPWGKPHFMINGVPAGCCSSWRRSSRFAFVGDLRINPIRRASGAARLRAATSGACASVCSSPQDHSSSSRSGVAKSFPNVPLRSTACDGRTAPPPIFLVMFTGWWRLPYRPIVLTSAYRSAACKSGLRMDAQISGFSARLEMAL